MFVVPAATPLTRPVPSPTVATEVLLLVHKPPDVASDNDVVNPAQTASVPLITAGSGFTVTIVELAQVVANV